MGLATGGAGETHIKRRTFGMWANRTTAGADKSGVTVLAMCHVERVEGHALYAFDMVGPALDGWWMEDDA